MSLDDIELIELNEAFATQYLACEKELKLRYCTNVTEAVSVSVIR